jgi:hypothetical protein
VYKPSPCYNLSVTSKAARATPARAKMLLSTGGPVLVGLVKFSSRPRSEGPRTESLLAPPPHRRHRRPPTTSPLLPPQLRHIATGSIALRRTTNELHSPTRVPQSPERTTSSTRPQDLRRQVPVPSLVQDCKILNIKHARCFRHYSDPRFLPLHLLQINQRYSNPQIFMHLRDTRSSPCFRTLIVACTMRNV